MDTEVKTDFTKKVLGFPKARQVFLNVLVDAGLAESEFLTASDIKDLVEKSGIPFPYWITRSEEFRLDRGVFANPLNGEPKVTPNKVTKASKPKKVSKASKVAGKDFAPTLAPDMPTQMVTPMETTEAPVVMPTAVIEYVPAVDKTFVPWGPFADIKKIV